MPRPLNQSTRVVKRGEKDPARRRERWRAPASLAHRVMNIPNRFEGPALSTSQTASYCATTGASLRVLSAKTSSEEHRRYSLAHRVGVFAYGLACYAVFFVTFLYAFGWVGSFMTPTSLDAPWKGDGPLGWTLSLLVNLGLLLVFAVQHSVMARPWFKAWWTRIVPEAAERSTYVLLSSLALIGLFVFWQPLGGVVWDVQSAPGRVALVALSVCGWLLVFYATFLINHFDLFGLRQVWLHLRGRPYTHLKFQVPGAYRVVRHPLYVGWLTAFWAAPTMTGTHLVFAVVTTVYILMAIRWEERDLVELHGDNYRRYQAEVPMLIPGARRTMEA